MELDNIKYLKSKDFIKSLKSFENNGYLFPLTNKYLNYDELYKDDSKILWSILYEHQYHIPVCIVAYSRTENKILLFEIKRDLRGKGLGSYLIKQITKDGVWHLRAKNKRAKNFYIKNGFHESPENRDVLIIGDTKNEDIS